MLRQFEIENGLDAKLSNYTDEHLNQLYLRVFNTDDGMMVLRDLANRCYAGMPLNTDGWSQERMFMNEGMRCAYLSIVTRMKRAVTKQEG